MIIFFMPALFSCHSMLHAARLLAAERLIFSPHPPILLSPPARRCAADGEMPFARRGFAAEAPLLMLSRYRRPPTPACRDAR